MSLKTTLLSLLLLAAQPVCAVEIEMDMDKAQWMCPSSVTVKGVERRLTGEHVLGGPPEVRPEGDESLAYLRGAPREPQHIFSDREVDETYLLCEYSGLSYGVLVHAKGATFCGWKNKKGAKGKYTQTACWTTPLPTTAK